MFYRFSSINWTLCSQNYNLQSFVGQVDTSGQVAFLSPSLMLWVPFYQPGHWATTLLRLHWHCNTSIWCAARGLPPHPRAPTGALPSRLWCVLPESRAGRTWGNHITQRHSVLPVYTWGSQSLVSWSYQRFPNIAPVSVVPCATSDQ